MYTNHLSVQFAKAIPFTKESLEIIKEALEVSNSSFSANRYKRTIELDTELIDELYVKAFTFREEVKNQIGRAKKEADSAKSEHEDVQKTLDDDVFSGVTGDTKTGQ